MRKHIIFGLVVVVALLSFGMTDSKKEKKVEIIELESKPIQPIVVEEIQIPEVDDLINALIMVESNGNDSAVGDTHLGEPSIGVLQIRPIMVREVNRILKLKGTEYRYKLKDRWDKEKSIEMFLIWKEFHHSDSNYEEIARSWNGGTKGPKNPRTYNYWKKVENQLTSL
jgi:hypothetical protein